MLEAVEVDADEDDVALLLVDVVAGVPTFDGCA